ncbi:hypothetical protein EVAR_103006_1 [Eumeta japonica]|uniref:CCHC-type domain-containing protein n=1 Tax=Eumeta variegata TaxID=151549 RepID=A0A4C1UR27_EUMVA|nr:hypothetical protein EVAR_103006_1 [Eumeta japonica]
MPSPSKEDSPSSEVGFAQDVPRDSLDGGIQSNDDKWTKLMEQQNQNFLALIKAMKLPTQPSNLRLPDFDPEKKDMDARAWASQCYRRNVKPDVRLDSKHLRSSDSKSKTHTSTATTTSTITRFHCRELGHYASSCPRRGAVNNVGAVTSKTTTSKRVDLCFVTVPAGTLRHSALDSSRTYKYAHDRLRKVPDSEVIDVDSESVLDDHSNVDQEAMTPE